MHMLPCWRSWRHRRTTVFCEFTCKSCSQQHSLHELSLPELKVALMIFAHDPPQPYTAWEWVLILAAEIAKRQRS
jgi:hypothetical protein